MSFENPSELRPYSATASDSSSAHRVAVLGSLHFDIVVHAPDRPRKGETLPGQSWMYKAGGKGGNQAVAAARFGANTAMIGRVGTDDFGQRLLAHLQKEQVDTQHVRIDSGSGSGMSVAIIDAEGDYGAVIVSQANLRIGEEDVHAASTTIEQAGVLVLQNEIPGDANLFAAEWARRSEVRVILNAAPARSLPPALAAKVDLLVVNAVEAEMMCGQPVESLSAAEAAAVQLASQVAEVIVTAGGLGLVLIERGRPAQACPAYPVRLVDTHGAGDTFVGALAARLASGSTLLDATRFANAAAALFVSTPADRKQSVTADRVALFLAEKRELPL